MADPASDFQFPNASYFNIYADLPPASNTFALPGGPCNYIDVTGSGGHKCGCRRFWSRASFGGSGPDRGNVSGYPPGMATGYDDQTAWCMCSHHACFHDDVREGQASSTLSNSHMNAMPVSSSFIDGQENERPRANREPLTLLTTPERSVSFHSAYTTTASQRMDLSAAPNPAASFYRTREASVPVMREYIEPVMDSTLPNTMTWAGATQPNPEEVLPLPDASNWAGATQPNSDPSRLHYKMLNQSLIIPSQPSSTTSSARIAYLKPFSGKGLNTFSGARNTVLEPLREEVQLPVPQVQEVPSYDADQTPTVANTPTSARHTDVGDGPRPEPDQASALRADRQTLDLLSRTVQGYEQRFENLENISFHDAAHDVCHEKHDEADLRMTEHESRLEEHGSYLKELASRLEELEQIERNTPNNSSIYCPPRHGANGSDTLSIASFSSSTEGCCMSRTELRNYMQTIKAEMSRLQSLASANTKPWEVEVIFLPFPLRRVWVQSRDFNSRQTEADPWTQMPHNAEPQSAGHGDSAGPEVESDWLYGRACTPDRMIDQRLRSRGLVKTITVRSPDAQSVHQAMMGAFGTLLKTFSRMQGNVHHGSTVHHHVSEFLGLQSPWVPLRKVHSDSRLRFLTPAEMVTSATWDVQFLSSSVVMKSDDIPRLYITHPEAYLQDIAAYENSWTWQRLRRDVPRVTLNPQSSQERAGEEEDCWVWNHILDEQVSSQPFDMPLYRSPQDRWRAMTSQNLSRSPIVETTVKPVANMSRRSVSRGPSPAVFTARAASKTPRIRTGSMPPPPLMIPASSMSKRTLTPYERVASPAKKRVGKRSTRSPSVRRGMSRFTPRLSTASPTPMPEFFRVRSTTPFYATPASFVPYSERPNAGNNNGGMEFNYDASEDESLGEDDEMDDDDDDDDVENDDSTMADTEVEVPGSEPDGQLPEDEPWPGIEDDNDPPMSIHVDQETMARSSGPTNGEQSTLSDDESERLSSSSSAPSEYPSTQPPWPAHHQQEQEFRGWNT